MKDTPSFAFEHLALNLPDWESFQRWYIDNLGLVVVRSVPSDKSFLADSSGTVVFELYHNTSAPNMELRATAPLTFHVAFVVDDVEASAERLIAAGAEAMGYSTAGTKRARPASPNCPPMIGPASPVPWGWRLPR